MALGGFLLKRKGHPDPSRSGPPQRTCTGCKAVTAQHDLVRVAVDGGQLVLDRTRALPGRGAYVHARAACVTIPGLARSLKRTVSRADLDRIVASLSEMSPARDNPAGPDEASDDPSENDPGLAGADTVETQPRIKAKDDRSEDARV